MPTSVLPRLRKETASAHARLEDTVNIEKSIKDLDSYKHLLQKFLGYYHPLEMALEAVSGWEHWHIDLAARRKGPWLRQDLSALGLSESQIAYLPACTEIPKPDTLAKAFGCAYVLEGSTLGGRHIAFLLDGSPVPSSARHFFSSHRAEVLPMWKSFCAAIEHFNTLCADETDDLVQAANQTFECLQQWMVSDSTPPPRLT